MRVRLLLPILGFVLLAGLAPAQGCFLSAGFNRNDAQAGFMFDLVATNPNGVDITGFVVHLDSGLYDIDVYERAGSHIGFELSSAGWNLVGSATNLISNGNDHPTELPISMSVSIPSGATHAFYIVITNQTTGMWGILGTGFSNLWVSNGDLDMLEGTGGPIFGGTVNSVWNGIIRYNVTGVPAQYQTNSFGAHMDIDEAITYACQVGVSNKDVVNCGGVTLPASGTLSLRTGNSGQAWELVTSPDPTKPLGAGALPIPGGIVNLDGALVVNWTFNNGGLIPLLLPFVSGFPGALSAGFTVNYEFTSATNVTAQGVITDPASIAGYTLTQANELHVGTAAGLPSFPGPTGDDTRVTVNFADPPLCWAQNGLDFYGTTYTQLHVESNGRVLFGTPPSSLFFTLFQPADLLSGAGSVGMWADLNPSPQTGFGSVQITFSSPFINVDYVNIQSFGEPGVLHNYQVQFDTSPGSGIISINGLQGIVPDPEVGQVDDAWLGISAGATLGLPATDPGTVVSPGPLPGFAPTGGAVQGPVLNPRDMLYDYVNGVAGVPSVLNTVSNGTASVTFIPDGMGNYLWFGQ